MDPTALRRSWYVCLYLCDMMELAEVLHLLEAKIQGRVCGRLKVSWLQTELREYHTCWLTIQPSLI